MRPSDEVRVVTYEGAATALTDDLRALYAAVYAEPLVPDPRPGREVHRRL